MQCEDFGFSLNRVHRSPHLACFSAGGNVQAGSLWDFTFEFLRSDKKPFDAELQTFTTSHIPIYACIISAIQYRPYSYWWSRDKGFDMFWWSAYTVIQALFPSHPPKKVSKDIPRSNETWSSPPQDHTRNQWKWQSHAVTFDHFGMWKTSSLQSCP